MSNDGDDLHIALCERDELWDIAQSLRNQLLAVDRELIQERAKREAAEGLVRQAALFLSDVIAAGDGLRSQRTRLYQLYQTLFDSIHTAAPPTETNPEPHAPCDTGDFSRDVSPEQFDRIVDSISNPSQPTAELRDLFRELPIAPVAQPASDAPPPSDEGRAVERVIVCAETVVDEAYRTEDGQAMVIDPAYWQELRGALEAVRAARTPADDGEGDRNECPGCHSDLTKYDHKMSCGRGRGRGDWCQAPNPAAREGGRE